MLRTSNYLMTIYRVFLTMDMSFANLRMQSVCGWVGWVGQWDGQLDWASRKKEWPLDKVRV